MRGNPAGPPSHRCPSATVIDITPHRRAPTPPAPDPDIADDTRNIAAFWQAQFLAAGLSLADPDTAAAHRCTLRALAVLIDGAGHLGTLDPDARDYLQAVLAEADRAPDSV